MDETLNSLMYYRFKLTRKPQLTKTSSENLTPNETVVSKYDPPIRSGPFELINTYVHGKSNINITNYLSSTFPKWLSKVALRALAIF